MPVKRIKTLDMDHPVVYTVGHSTHHVDHFLGLIRDHGVNCIIDVRTVAASSYNPQYNQESLKQFLKNNKVAYLHLAQEFGARQTDPHLLDEEGKLDFERVRKTWWFKQGLEKIWQGIAKGDVMALMCSESEPIDCHRFSMVSVGLENDGFEVRHILKDHSIITNGQLQDELLDKYKKKLPQVDLFNPHITREIQLEVAFRLKNKEIGYVPDSTN